MHLAEKFQMTLGELQQRMTWSEYVLWCTWEARKGQIQEISGGRRHGRS